MVLHLPTGLEWVPRFEPNITKTAFSPLRHLTQRQIQQRTQTGTIGMLAVSRVAVSSVKEKLHST